MTEPWRIHVCPVHGPRTPTMLGDCPVGCCAEVMEVVRVVRDTREDRMDNIEREHKAELAELADAADQADARFYAMRDDRDRLQTLVRVIGGERDSAVEQLEGAVEAIEAGRQWIEPYGKADAPLAEQITALVDACSYWHQVAESGGQSTAEEAFEQSSGGETLEEAQARQLRGEHAFSPQPETPLGTDENCNDGETR